MKKTLTLALALIYVLFVLTGCTGAPAPTKTDAPAAAVTEAHAASTSGPKDTLVFGNTFEPTSFDAQLAGAGTPVWLVKNINDTLVDFDDTGKIVGNLADSWEISPDGLVYTFKLKQGVTWHNGEPFKAADVKYSIERAKELPHMKTKTSMIDSVEAPSDDVVIVKLSGPYAPYLAQVAWLFILNEKAVTEAGDDYGVKPVGTGPYMLKEWVSGNKVILTAFDKYHKTVPAIKNIEIRTVVDMNTRAASVESGELDMTLNVGALDVDNLLLNDNLEVLTGNTIYYWYFLMNTKTAPFDNVKVRQAIAYGINRETVNLAANDGKGLVAMSPLTPISFGYSDKIKPYEYNVDKAKALLQEAGVAEGTKIELTCSEGHTKMAAEAIQADLKKIGLDVSIKVVEWGTMLSEATKGNFQATITGWGDLSNDADGVLRTLYASANAGPAGNYGSYSNPEYDKLVEAAKVEQDQAKRADMYFQAQEILYTDYPAVGLYFGPNNLVYQKGIKGAKLSPSNAVYFADLSY